MEAGDWLLIEGSPKERRGIYSIDWDNPGWALLTVVIVSCVCRDRTDRGHRQVWLRRTHSQGAVLQEGSLSAALPPSVRRLVGGSAQRRGRPHPSSVHRRARPVRKQQAFTMTASWSLSLYLYMSVCLCIYTHIHTHTQICICMRCWQVIYY